MDSSKQTYKPEEYNVERICKAFIRLLDAPLVKEQEVQIDGKRSENGRGITTISTIR